MLWGGIVPSGFTLFGAHCFVLINGRGHGFFYTVIATKYPVPDPQGISQRHTRWELGLSKTTHVSPCPPVTDSVVSYWYNYVVPHGWFVNMFSNVPPFSWTNRSRLISHISKCKCAPSFCLLSGIYPAYIDLWLRVYCRVLMITSSFVIENNIYKPENPVSRKTVDDGIEKGENTVWVKLRPLCHGPCNRDKFNATIISILSKLK